MSKFNILYSGAQLNDARTLCAYIDEFYHAVGVKICDIEISRILSVLQTITQEFPSPLGVDNSSPFKKVAAFTVSFAAEKPIYSPLPEEHFGKLATHQNAILAVTLSLDALEGAVIECRTRGDIVLKNHIRLSNHYWKDLIVAVSKTIPVYHFDYLSLIYEALAYQANPEASYERVI